MILASHQPDFFPWMGYFYKIYQSDVFVFSDNVQFSKTGRHNYNQILTASGSMRFTLPVHYHVKNLNEIDVAATDKDIDRLLKTLWIGYKKSSHFHVAFPVLENILPKAIDAESLASFNKYCILELAKRFGMTVGKQFLDSSALELEGRKDTRIINMAKAVGADTYLSGDGAKDYHIEEDYRENGIKLVYSDFVPTKYPQLSDPGDEYYSVIDYVMNCGFKIPEEWERWTR